MSAKMPKKKKIEKYRLFLLGKSYDLNDFQTRALTSQVKSIF